MGITTTEVKKYLRVNHDKDDIFIASQIEFSKNYIKTSTGVEYSDNDYEYEQLIFALVHHYYFNRGVVSEKEVKEIPFTLTELINKISFRGAING